MAKEIAPIELVEQGTPEQKRYYLRKALWSDKGFVKARDEVRENDLIFWLGGVMPHACRVKCDSQDEAREVIERFRDGILPEGGWQECGICLEGMKLLVTDKDLNILADLSVSEVEIANGLTKDGIRLVCDGELFESEALRDDQVEVSLEGVGEAATWAWTMHTSGKLDLSALKIRYRNYRNQIGRKHSVIVSYCYGKCEGEGETHQWARVHSCRYAVHPTSALHTSDASLHESDVELRVALGESDGSVNICAWRGTESFPVGEIVKNPKKYAAQYGKFADVMVAWHANADEFMEEDEMSLGLFSREEMIVFQEELKGYEIHDYRSKEVRNREAEFRKVRFCEGYPEDIILAAGWKPTDGEDAAIKVMARHCGVSEEVARISFEEGMWGLP